MVMVVNFLLYSLTCSLTLNTNAKTRSRVSNLVVAVLSDLNLIPMFVNMNDETLSVFLSYSTVDCLHEHKEDFFCTVPWSINR